MKNIRRHYKVFFPLIYTLSIWVATPVIAVAMELFISNSYYNSTVSVLVTSMLLSMSHMFFDYFVFNGISSKNSSLRLLKSSKRGYRVLKNGLMIDQGLRLLNIILCEILGTVAVNCIWDDVNVPIVSSILFGLLVYAFTTAALIGLRHIDGVSLYGPTMSIAAIVVMLALLGVFLLMAYGILSLAWAYVIGIIVSILATFFGEFAVLRSYKKSFIR